MKRIASILLLTILMGVNTGTSMAQDTLQVVIEYAPFILFKNVNSSKSGYQTPDGAYCHHVNRQPDPERTLTHQGPIPTGLYIPEGDVDAIGKATTGITSNIFAAYGFKTKVPIFCDRDWQLYKSIMYSAKPVIKKDTKIYR